MHKIVKNAGLMMASAFGFCVLSASAGFAQTNNPVVFKCNASVESNIATSNVAEAVTSATFVTFHSVGFFRPIGVVSDCVTVTFAAETSCKGASSEDRCYIRVLHNGVEMRPKGTGEQVFDSESDTAESHSHEWVSRGLVEGQNTFTIQVKVGKPGTTFVLDDWIMDVQLMS